MAHTDRVAFAPLFSRKVPRCPCGSRQVMIVAFGKSLHDDDEVLGVRRRCQACRRMTWSHLHETDQPRWHPGKGNQ